MRLQVTKAGMTSADIESLIVKLSWTENDFPNYTPKRFSVHWDEFDGDTTFPLTYINYNTLGFPADTSDTSKIVAGYKDNSGNVAFTDTVETRFAILQETPVPIDTVYADVDSIYVVFAPTSFAAQNAWLTDAETYVYYLVLTLDGLDTLDIQRKSLAFLKTDSLLSILVSSLDPPIPDNDSTYLVSYTAIETASNIVWNSGFIDSDTFYVPPTVEDVTPPPTTITADIKFDSTGGIRNQVYLTYTGALSTAGDTGEAKIRIYDPLTGDSITYMEILPLNQQDGLLNLAGQMSISGSNLVLSVFAVDTTGNSIGETGNIDPVGVHDTLFATSFNGWREVVTDTNASFGWERLQKMKFYFNTTDSVLSSADSSFDIKRAKASLSNDSITWLLPDTLFNASLYIGTRGDSLGEESDDVDWFHNIIP
jgi:hypothetical protein